MAGSVILWLHARCSYSQRHHIIYLIAIAKVYHLVTGLQLLLAQGAVLCTIVATRSDFPARHTAVLRAHTTTHIQFIFYSVSYGLRNVAGDMVVPSPIKLAAARKRPWKVLPGVNTAPRIVRSRSDPSGQQEPSHPPPDASRQHSEPMSPQKAHARPDFNGRRNLRPPSSCQSPNRSQGEVVRDFDATLDDVGQSSEDEILPPPPSPQRSAPNQRGFSANTLPRARIDIPSAKNKHVRSSNLHSVPENVGGTLDNASSSSKYNPALFSSMRASNQSKSEVAENESAGHVPLPQYPKRPRKKRSASVDVSDESCDDDSDESRMDDDEAASPKAVHIASVPEPKSRTLILSR